MSDKIYYSAATLKTALVDAIDRPDQPCDYCYAALMSWAIDDDAPESLNEIMDTSLQEGAKCSTGPGDCWCGKYRGEES
jgi:hypothetical protein